MVADINTDQVFDREDPEDWFELPPPDDSPSFFTFIRQESEKYWSHARPRKAVTGFQVQKGTQWRPGLSGQELNDFEKMVGFELPASLRNFYSTMNGLTKPGINFSGSSKTSLYRPVFYSFPDDWPLMQEMIGRAAMENASGISRIFPVYQHRYMLIDVPDNPILSINGDDIVFWADSLSHLLVKEILSAIYNIPNFDEPPKIRPIYKYLITKGT